MAETLREFGRWTAQARTAEQDRLSRMTPSEWFLRLANERFEKPRLFGIAPVDGYWRIGDWTMAEIRKISLNDAKD